MVEPNITAPAPKATSVFIFLPILFIFSPTFSIFFSNKDMVSILKIIYKYFVVETALREAPTRDNAQFLKIKRNKEVITEK